MGKLICDNCQGPLIEQNGKILCAICGTEYTPAVERNYTADDFSEFFNNISIEEFQKIANRLVGTVVSNANHPEEFIALRSDGWIYNTRSYEPNYYGVVKIKHTFDGEIGITDDGELQADTEELAGLFARIQKAGVSDLKMKYIYKFQHYETRTDYFGQKHTNYDEFIGIDTEGNVVIYNPFVVFGLNKSNPEDVKKCGELVQWYKSLPPVKMLDCWMCREIVLTEEGTVLFQPNYTNDQVEAIQQWDKVESLYEWPYREFGDDFFRSCYLGLRKDGTLLAVGKDKNLKEDLSQNWNLEKTSDIVQIEHCGVGTGFLYRNGDLEIPKLGKNHLVAKNVVAIVFNGYICADGSLYLRTDSESYKFNRVPDVKLFNNIHTLHEEWSATRSVFLEKKQALQEASQNCVQFLESLRTEKESLLVRKEQLGLFCFKDRSEIKRKLEDLDIRIKKEEQALSSLKQQVLAVNGIPIRSKKDDTFNIASSTAAIYALRDDLMCRVSTPQKSTSVIGSAAVGGLIAGSAGAVVGAVYAADKNRKNQK
jgi:hypothetical protein